MTALFRFLLSSPSSFVGVSRIGTIPRPIDPEKVGNHARNRRGVRSEMAIESKIRCARTRPEPVKGGDADLE
jgi:hypothetical protein